MQPSSSHPRSTPVLAGAALAVLLAATPAPAQAPSSGPASLAPDAPRITLKWTTASEVDNYGYFVYRGLTADGPFEKRNEKAIPGAGNSEVPSHYVWQDPEVVEGTTYYYYLESVSVQGVREKFSPVLARTCCSKPKAEPAASPGPEAPAPSPSNPPEP